MQHMAVVLFSYGTQQDCHYLLSTVCSYKPNIIASYKLCVSQIPCSDICPSMAAVMATHKQTKLCVEMMSWCL